MFYCINVWLSQRDLDKLFKDYSIQENIDILHRVVNEAKDRKATGQIGNDVWKEDLEPRVAVCARTVPILESEVKRLQETLAEVSPGLHSRPKSLMFSVRWKRRISNFSPKLNAMCKRRRMQMNAQQSFSINSKKYVASESMDHQELNVFL